MFEPLSPPDVKEPFAILGRRCEQGAIEYE